MLALASDILLAVSRGELAPGSAVVGAAAHAIARLRPGGAGSDRGGALAERSDVDVRSREQGLASAGSSTEVSAHAAELAVGRAGSRAPRLVPPIEHVLAVAGGMRTGRLPFAAACARRGEETAVSAQAVRNACCRWLDLSASDWQPLCVAGSDDAALAVARRVAERQGWARQRIAAAFAVPVERLG